MQNFASDHFLEMTGLTRFHVGVVAWTILTAILILVVVGLCQKYAVFHNVDFREEQLRQSRIIYINHRGAY